MPMPKAPSSPLLAHAHTRRAYPRAVAKERADRDLSEATNDEVRQTLERLIPSKWKTQTAAAAALGIDQTTISKFLDSKQGASVPLAIRIYLAAGRDPSPLIGLPEGSLSEGVAPPELVALREHPDAANWSNETWGALRGLALASKDRPSQRDLYDYALTIEARVKAKAFAPTVIDDDPVEAARAKRRPRP